MAPKKDVAKAGKTKGKRRKTKDPNAPKRASSAFFIFSIEERGRIVSEKPELRSAIGEVAKITADKWKKMVEADREPYEKRAVLDKQRYLNEMAVYKKK